LQILKGLLPSVKPEKGSKFIATLPKISDREDGQRAEETDGK